MRRGTFDYKLDLNSQKKQPDQLTAIWKRKFKK
jgi:hypothetical protein